MDPMKKKIAECEKKNIANNDAMVKMKQSIGTTNTSILLLKQRVSDIDLCMKNISHIENKIKVLE